MKPFVGAGSIRPPSAADSGTAELFASHCAAVEHGRSLLFSLSLKLNEAEPPDSQHNRATLCASVRHFQSYFFLLPPMLHRVAWLNKAPGAVCFAVQPLPPLCQGLPWVGNRAGETAGKSQEKGRKDGDGEKVARVSGRGCQRQL